MLHLSFEILADGVRVGQQQIERRGPLQFFEVEYPVPAEAAQGKPKVTARSADA